MSPEPAQHEHDGHHGGEEIGERRKGVKDYTHFGIPKPAIEAPAYNRLEKNRQFLFKLFDIPVTWVREKVVEPLQAKNKAGNVYYHRKFPRVPTIDECNEGDYGCYFEANEQYKRDYQVDAEIVKIIRKRKNDCIQYERDDWAKNCVDAMAEYETTLTNFYLRYGEVGWFSTAIDVYMKQKHRMIWERRHPEKVDFMYAKDREEQKYIVPVKPGMAKSVIFPDNSRAQLHRRVPIGTGGTLVSDPDSPQDATKHYGKGYNQAEYPGKFEP